VKRFVWPAIKTLIAVIAAVALVKIAFFPSQNNSATADISPGYAANVKTVAVTTGNISNTVEVKGRIVQDATVEVQADLAGVVDSVAVEKDAQVNAGEPLLYIKHSEPQSPVTKTDEEGNVTQTPVADKVTKVTRRVNDLISSFQALSKLLNKIQPIVTRLKSVLDKIGSKSDDPAGTGHGPDDAMGQHQTRRHRPELQGHLHPQRRRPVGRRWPSARR